MKRSIIASALMSTLFISAGAFAADTGTLTITGEIKAATCTFADGKSNVEITMPKVFVSDINGLAANAALDSGMSGIYDVVIKCSGNSSEELDLNLTANKQVPGKSTIIGTDNELVGYYLYIDGASVEHDLNESIKIAKYKDGEAVGGDVYRIPLTAKYMKIKTGDVKSGVVTGTAVMRITND